jgi:hypothetical protein
MSCQFFLIDRQSKLGRSVLTDLIGEQVLTPLYSLQIKQLK